MPLTLQQRTYAESLGYNPAELEAENLDFANEQMLISTPDAADLVLKTQQTENGLTATSTTPTTTETPTPKIEQPKPKTPSVPEEGAIVSEAQARTFLGSNFTGAVRQSDGSYLLTSEALSRISGTPTTTPTKTDEEKQLETLQSEISSLKDKLNQSLISDVDLAQQHVAITAVWDAQIKQMEDINKRRAEAIKTNGYRLGGRFTGGIEGGMTGGMITEEQRQGVMRISELEAKKQAALIEAKTAAKKGNWDVYVKQIEIAEKAVTTKTEELKKIREEQDKKTKEIKDAKDLLEKNIFERVTKPKNDILVSVGEQSAPPEVLKAINECQDLVCAVDAAGEYINKIGSGIIGEYNFYKKEAISLGQKPLTFDEYQTRDANRKIAAAKMTNGLPNNISTQVDKLSAAFDISPIVKQFNEIQNKTASIYAIVDSGIIGGVGDLALIFEFMKSLDPTSVVRESEYDVASTASNPFKRVAAKMGGYVSNGQILPQEVRDEFARLSGVKLDVITKQYDNLRNETGRKIEKKTHLYEEAPGTDYLTDYAAAIPTGRQVIQDEAAAESKVKEIYPTHQKEVDSLITAKPDITYSEILQVLGQP